ncbi:MAG: GIY-YIG nuclease family protein [Patescibacteria group bacterium]
MEYNDFKKLKLPDSPGVYMFMKGKDILYIGKATSLRARARSYFSKDIVFTRGAHIENMVRLSKTVRAKTTDSVLEALVLESYLIKKHKPKYNTDEKDDKSFNFIIITKEAFPRILIVRGRDLLGELKTKNYKLKTSFGPFPKGGELREAMKIIRKIFPFRDRCLPALQGSTLGIQKGRTFVSSKPCFNRQIGLCPGVCSGEISKQDYSAQIRNLKLFLEGKKKTVVKNLEREMKTASNNHLFERAGELKQMLFSLNHIQDVALIKREMRGWQREESEIFRIESYDAAHLSGKNSVAVMTVIENGEVNKNEYRKFKLRGTAGADDLASLREVLRRRFNHFEWRMPNIVVVDGGVNQKRRAEKTLKEMGISVPIVAVVKDEFHKPRGILGEMVLVRAHDRAILLGNSEAHRFAIKYHRELRDKLFTHK